ncbi:erythromycin resistance leader peptide [Enterococcus faecium]
MGIFSIFVINTVHYQPKVKSIILCKILYNVLPVSH